jgi:hypothetical protein
MPALLLSGFGFSAKISLQDGLFRFSGTIGKGGS